MKRTLASLLCAVSCLLGQTAETIPFRAVLSPDNEVPAVQLPGGRGAGTVLLHVVRDANGQIVSGSIDFDVDYQWTSAADNQVTGLHIHRGAAGVNGPVVLDSGIRAGSTVEVPAPGANGFRSGNIRRQGQVLSASAAGLAAMRDMISDPSGFYLNLHTNVNPNGAIRAQVQRAEMRVLMGLMSPRNEVPAIADLNASGVISIVALATRDEAGRPTSGRVTFNINYTGFPEGTVFTGFHIHQGRTGVNGPVTIDTGISGANTVTPPASGAGTLNFNVEVDIARAAAVTTLESLFSAPGETYANLHTRVNPGGAIRATLRSTDTSLFRRNMLPANEVPPITDLAASAPAVFTLHTIRNAEGLPEAGTVVFDVNHRFPGETRFTGLHIHDGAAGVNGPVTLNSGLSGSNPIVSESGQGNIYSIATISNAAGVASMRSVVTNPEAHYINLHTTVHPGGAVRAQLADRNTALPRVSAVISAVFDPARTTAAPGSLIALYGSDLTKVQADLSGTEGTSVPTALNGTQVTIGGTPAPVFVLTPGYLIAQVPFEAQPGPAVPLVVRNANGESSQATLRVAAAAPTLFFDANGGIINRNDDSSYVSRDNPARAGDVILLWGTGFGQSTPPLRTGQIVPLPTPGVAASLFSTAPVAVTIGGQPAEIVYSVYSPMYAGLNLVAVRVPTGVSGEVPVVARVGGADSNTVRLFVR